jgi:hypothetical protein
MHIVSRIDDYGNMAWIALMVLGFVIWWPIGLAILGFILWSKRMGCGHRGSWIGRQDRWQRACGRWHPGMREARSGNTAFDAYREETLRRLEDEQREFTDYLNNLRQAKDKAEFDQFMTERRGRRQNPPVADEPEPGTQQG